MARQDEIKECINEIKNHFDTNLNNKFVKNILLKLDISIEVRQHMNVLLDYKNLYFDSKGSIEDIYTSLKAITFFIKEIRMKVLTNISNYTTSAINQASLKDANDKILYQMAVKNYPMNIKILANLCYKLLNMVIEYDNLNYPKDPAYKKFREVDEISNFLKDVIEEKMKGKN